MVENFATNMPANIGRNKMFIKLPAGYRKKNWNKYSLF